MSEALERLRAELDGLDRRLLETAARRVEVVGEISAIKAGSGLPRYDRERERVVYARARHNALELGLDPRTAEALVGVLLRASHGHQEAALRAGVTRRRVLVIGGGGRMGQRFVDAFRERGHEVAVLERDDGQDAGALIGAAEVVMIAVPMGVAEAVAREVAPRVAPGALLCDVNSLKVRVCAAMAGCAGEVLGMHPMFGPTVGSFTGQKVVLCPVRSGPLSAWMREELAAMGMERLEASAEEHDRMMAVVQVLVHFSTLVLGEALRSSGVDLTRSLAFMSPIYRLQLAFVGRLFHQDPSLYAEIEMSNPYGDEVRERFLTAARGLAAGLAAGDREGFVRSFEGVREWLGDFHGDAMRLSDLVIDTLVAQP